MVRRPERTLHVVATDVAVVGHRRRIVRARVDRGVAPRIARIGRLAAGYAAAAVTRACRILKNAGVPVPRQERFAGTSGAAGKRKSKHEAERACPPGE